ncbi:hypothetical protein LguiB_034961 [Lonicera macranthoides]
MRSPCYKAILSLIINAICWELWLNKNKGKFDGVFKGADQIIYYVKANLQAIFVGHHLLQKRTFADVVLLRNLHVDVLAIYNRGWIFTR